VAASYRHSYSYSWKAAAVVAVGDDFGDGAVDVVGGVDSDDAVAAGGVGDQTSR
jgi:hypothetical protein